MGEARRIGAMGWCLVLAACAPDDADAGAEGSSSTSTGAPTTVTSPMTMPADDSGADTNVDEADTGVVDSTSTSASVDGSDDGSSSDTGVVNPCPPMVEDGLLIEHIVAPQDTDPTIDAYLEDHYAYIDTREVAPRGKLLLHLAGSNGTPSQTLTMLHEGARFGFHVVGLRYPNDFDIYGLCGGDGDCFGALREEELDGDDHTPVVDIGEQNGIEHRLVALLELLHAENPEEGWCWWIDGDVPRWSEIVVSGHSHGASTAGLIGTVRAVDRVVMFAGPYDHTDPDIPATWVSGASLTAADRIYGIAGAGDDQYSQHLVNWDAMGLPGEPVDVDVSAPPYDGSHRLISLGGDHGSVATDEANRPAWEYLFAP
jgi:hypothetical protein